MTIDGQTSIFDLLESETPKRTNTLRPRNPATYSSLHFVPSPENPVHCVMCGKAQIHYYDYQVNHSPLGWYDGQRMCTAMNLTRNHVTSCALQIRALLDGGQPHQCCYGKGDLHGKSVRKPTVMQLADHLRERIEVARQTWGVRAELFDLWAANFLIEHGLFKYSLDPAEYPWEFEGEQ